MAETINSYLPDIDIGWDVEVARAHLTEITMARSGKEQRRGVWPASGFQRMSATGAGSELHERRAIAKFFDDRRGRLQAFYLFRPDRARLENFGFTSLGYSTTRLITPFKEGTHDEIRKANVVQAFTLTALPLRASGRFAQLFLDSTAVAGRVDAGSAANLKTVANLTVSAWIYPISTGVTMRVTSNMTVSASGFSFGRQTSGELDFTINWDEPGVDTQTSASTVPNNQWTHVAITKSGTTLKFFINGILDVTRTLANTGTDATQNYLIGCAANGGAPNAFFDGLLSEVRHYAAALSDANINNIFVGSHAGPVSTNLRGHWKLDDGFGTTSAAEDSSGNANHGTLTGNGVMWHGGEDLLILGAAAAASSSMQIWVSGRQRLTGRFDNDELPEGFLQNVAATKGQQRLAIREVR